jgi:hypothetical protein
MSTVGQSRWRSVVPTVLIVLAAVLAPLAVVSVWVHDDIGDTDRYVAAVTPLGSDPVVQDAISDRVSRELLSRLDALAAPLANALRSVVEEQVATLVRSEAFQDVWVAANRGAHTQVVAVLTGRPDGPVEVKDDDTVQVNLAPVIERVKQRLVDNGFPLASRIPAIDAQFTIFESADLPRAQAGFRLLGGLARVLPWLSPLLLGIAVWLSRSRRRTLLAGSLAMAASMLLLGLVVILARRVYLDAVPPGQLAPDAAAAVFDALVAFVQRILRAILLLFLATAAVAWALGPSAVPTAVRRRVSGATSGIR